MENNKNKKSVTFQGDMLNFCDFIQVFVFTPNHHLNDIILTRIRHNCSNLNADLFRVNISANSNCRCGAVNENAHHYFLECILNVEQRNRLFSSINPLVNVHLKLITNGNAALNAETNAVILSAVLKYIKDTHRFM